ncbi:SDR family oxidoreductase [Kibdelosporangium phytohabitans]|uniref:Short-chain dehydrogenase n=1 Tax=Kibdelosporangium phytohabitans TaxID=860235 RepID=A0A0N9I2P1_9PSEU|nr:SDR family oxidoreductase [Kibdelosporangium phytohabitans]ALG08729.1 short-chain dehydrogenase [Kibdelosporangium phytohabitans]MBE1470156.1 NADP-dependent 3-hydroxy acid dehydrogenase YdfG [Kibdelosporangium phytohabitans]
MRYPAIPLGNAVVLVTGAGRGIGAAAARLFAAGGATVWLGDLDADFAAATAREIGPSAHSHPLDVTDRDSFAAFAEAAITEHGRIDVLVNNAGVMPVGDFVEEPDATSRTTIDVNVWGLINGMRVVLPHMIRRARGHVVNVASMAGKVPIPGMAVYNASKFAALGLSLAVREEYADTGVSVSTVLPSAVRTRLSSGIPLGHGMPTVEPEDVARAVVGSVSRRRAEIPVPGYLAGWGLLNTVVPEPVMRLGRRVIGDRRALTSVDPITRGAYERAIDSQTQSRKQGAAS